VVLYAEVQYYFQIKVDNFNSTLAMVLPYHPPHEKLFKDSNGALYACKRQDQLRTINVKTIQAVVGMPPLPLTPEEESAQHLLNYCFVAENPFYDLTAGGIDEPIEDSDEEEIDV
jgi:hypothetical protein